MTVLERIKGFVGGVVPPPAGAQHAVELEVAAARRDLEEATTGLDETIMRALDRIEKPRR